MDKNNPFIGNIRSTTLNFTIKESDFSKIKNHIQGEVFKMQYRTMKTLLL